MTPVELPLKFGPKMQALGDDRRRKFAWIMGHGERFASKAARAAGYSDPGPHSTYIRKQAHLLVHDPDIQAAIHEVSRDVLFCLAPDAIKAAKRILDDSKHPAHGRMIETILDRTGHFARTEHKVTVEHTVDTAELEALARRLAAEAGIDPARLIGSNDAEGHVDFSARQVGGKNRHGSEMKVIEGEVVNGIPHDANREPAG